MPWTSTNRCLKRRIGHCLSPKLVLLHTSAAPWPPLWHCEKWYGASVSYHSSLERSPLHHAQLTVGRYLPDCYAPQRVAVSFPNAHCGFEQSRLPQLPIATRQSPDALSRLHNAGASSHRYRGHALAGHLLPAVLWLSRYHPTSPL